MCMQPVTFQSRSSLTPSQIADLRLAASKLTGPARRSFEAEMTLKYGEGNRLKAEALFGWGRQTVALGLAVHPALILLHLMRYDEPLKTTWMVFRTMWLNCFITSVPAIRMPVYGPFPAKAQRCLCGCSAPATTAPTCRRGSGSGSDSPTISPRMRRRMRC